MSKTTKNKIEPERWYKLLEIVELGLFPWCKDVKTVGKWVRKDKKSKNVLRAMQTGKGRQTRYNILGRHIQEFVESVEQGHYI